MPSEYYRGIREAFTARTEPLDYDVLEQAISKTKSSGFAFDYGVGYLVGTLLCGRKEIVEDEKTFDMMQSALSQISQRVPPSVRKTILRSINRMRKNLLEPQKLQSLEAAIS